MVNKTRPNPSATTFPVSKIVAEARRGKLRVPHFQRGLKWDADDVANLFDSIYRGYPVGSLLLWIRPGEASAEARVGPVEIHDAEQVGVRWLVDGQQRVTALVAALTPRDVADPRFDVWFDPDDERFYTTRPMGPSPQWVPVWRLLDAAELGDFLDDWEPGRANRDRRRALHEAGRRIREFGVPAYEIETDDDAALREIFRRTNRQGRQLQETDIFDALVVDVDRTDSLQSVGEQLASDLGWGTIERGALLKAVIVHIGGDLTKRLSAQPGGRDLGDDHEALKQGIRELRSAFLRTIVFLRDEAGISHRTALPYAAPLIVLPALFHRYPDPSSTSRRRLVQWVWRGLTTGTHDRSGPLRQAAAAAVDNASGETVVDRMLNTVPTRRGEPWEVDRPFLATSAHSRIGLLTLAAMSPRGVTGHVLNLSAVFGGDECTRKALTRGGDLRSTIANRLLLPSGETPARMLAHARRFDDPESRDICVSHGIDQEAATAWASGNHDGFLHARKLSIERAVAELERIRAGWEFPVVPNVRDIIAVSA